MIVIDITDEQINLAKTKAEEMGRLRNSIRRGEGNVAGFLGEIIFAKHFNGTINNTYDYDVIVKGKKVDVKTKETTVIPEPYYFATVAGYNIKQKCDYYYFVRVNIKEKKAYLLGGLSKSGFYKEAIFYKEGDLDPTSNLGWTFRANCYNVEISKLKQSKKFDKSI